LGVDADAKVRFERLIARDRQGDPVSWEEFQRLEAKETLSADPRAQQLTETFAMREHLLMNDGGVDELETRLAQWLESLAS
jgi:dephospho-CoA kinase